jgi:hypothetical protein
MQLVDRTPPDGFTGIGPPISVSPFSISRKPSPGPHSPRSSYQTSSAQVAGSYTSKTSKYSIGFETPSLR